MFVYGSAIRGSGPYDIDKPLQCHQWLIDFMTYSARQLKHPLHFFLGQPLLLDALLFGQIPNRRLIDHPALISDGPRVGFNGKHRSVLADALKFIDAGAAVSEIANQTVAILWHDEFEQVHAAQLFH